MVISYEPVHVALPSLESRRILWHVLSQGIGSRDEPEHHEIHDKPGALLIWILSGHGSIQIENGSFPVHTGPSCWLLDLTCTRTYLPAPDTTLVTTGLHFSGPALEVWLDLLGCGREFSFSKPSDMVAIRRVHRRIIDLVTRQPLEYEWQSHLLITQVLGMLLRARGVLFNPHRFFPEPVAKVLDAVSSDRTRNWSVLELADLSGTSYSSLRSLFKQACGESIKEFLQRNRLEQARLRLRDPRLSVKEVAYELNFASEQYFSYFFRAAAGMSPAQFRNLVKQPVE